MDRSKWEVDNKSFGEVFNLFMGRTPSRDNDSYWQNGKYEWLSIGDMGDTKYLSETKEKISEEAIANMQQVPENTVVMSFKLSIGKVSITSIPLYTNEAIMAFPPKEGYHILPTFLYYYLKAYKWQSANRAAMGKTLNKAVISNARVSIPNVEDQQRIVAELDCLNEMIAVKQEQLKVFDNLAQSIFYDMFGDLSLNNKGWQKKPFTEIAVAKTGITYKPDNVKDAGTIVLRSSNVQDDELAFDDVVRVDLPISEKYHVQNGDILMCSRNGSARLVGKTARIMNVDEIMTWGAFMTIIRSQYNDFLLHYFKTDTFRDSLASSKTTTVHQITIGMLNALTIPLPPLTLQQQFADKIEAIEKQKAIIKSSIKELEDLFNARMDFYFN